MRVFSVLLASGLFCAASLFAQDVAVKPVSAKASSVFPADSSNYHAKNAIDGYTFTAWSPKRTKNANVDEWIEFDFGKTVQISKIKLYNGWIKSDSLWKHNSRVKRATLIYSDGTKQSLLLDDTKSLQTFNVGLKETSSLRLRIDEIYAGVRWNQEACISEVYFYFDETMTENYKKYEALLQPFAQKDTIAAYEEFLAAYPQAPQKKDIENIIEQKSFEAAKQTATIAAYESFMKKYPDSSYFNEVQRLVYKAAFDAASKQNSVQAYMDFKAAYPKAPQVKTIDDKMLELANFALRQTYKEGVIGERYVPTSTYTSSTPNSTTTYINGKAYTSTTYDKSTSYSGGNSEKVYGYKMIYDITNQGKKYYIVSLQANWDGYYSQYQTYQTGAWGGGDTRARLVEKTQPSKYVQTFLLGPQEIYKDQFEVGEKKPEDLKIVVSQLVEVEKEYYEGLVQALSYSQKKEAKNEK